MLHVLVVDDDEAIRGLVQLILIEAGHRVSTARSGEQALGLIDEEVFDLILTDYRMPGMSGAELVGRVREHPHGGDVPILLVTGTLDDGPLEGLDIEGRLPKPFDVGRLLALVRAFADKEHRWTEISQRSA
jgi:CheY-like chemotaxis protein